jgi:hypothetical protein
MIRAITAQVIKIKRPFHYNSHILLGYNYSYPDYFQKEIYGEHHPVSLCNKNSQVELEGQRSVKKHFSKLRTIQEALKNWVVYCLENYVSPDKKYSGIDKPVYLLFLLTKKIFAGRLKYSFVTGEICLFIYL